MNKWKQGAQKYQKTSRQQAKSLSYPAVNDLESE